METGEFLSASTDSSSVTLPGDGAASRAGCGEYSPCDYPLDVSYCGVCSLPHEFCEYSPTYSKCKEWMKSQRPELYAQLGDEEDDAGGEGGDESIAVMCGATPGLKGILKAPKSEDDYMAKTSRRRVRWEPANTVTVGTMPRGKKMTTVVKGLAEFGVDVKKASRTLAQKFACGVSSVEDQGLLIQGDVADEVIQLLKAKFKEVPSDVIRNVGEIKR